MRRRNGVDRARYEQVIDQRDEARKEAAEHVCKIVELCGDVDKLNEQLTAAREQITQQRAIRKDMVPIAEYEAEKKRADHLQARLDQALGLDAAAVAAGGTWQDRREQKMRFDK